MAGFGFGGGSGGRLGGGSLASVNATVPVGATGQVYTLTTSLLTNPSWSKISGSSNLSVSGSNIVANTGLTAGASQSLILRAVSGTNAIEFQITLTGESVVTAPVVPAAPSLTLSGGNGQITISWTDGSNGGSSITAHNLYRGTSAGGEVLIGSIATGSPYTDTGLVNGTTYFYRLSAINAAGEGALSTSKSATPQVILPILAIAAPAEPVPDGNGQVSYQFTVSRTGNTSIASSVLWSVSGTVDTGDFGGTLPSGVLSFATGATAGTISVALSENAGAGKDLTVSLSSPVNATISTGLATVHISANEEEEEEEEGLLPELNYDIIDDFEDTAFSVSHSNLLAISSDTSERKTTGNAGLNLQSLSSLSNTYVTRSTAGEEIDFSNYEVLAICTDKGSDPASISGSASLSIITGGQSYSRRYPSGASGQESMESLMRGKVWQSFRTDRFRKTDFNGEKLDELGAVTAYPRVTIANTSDSNGATNLTVDSLIGIPSGANLTSRKPSVCLTFDDANVAQYTNRNWFFSRGIMPTYYVPFDTLGYSGGKLSVAEQHELYDMGGGLCVDSGPWDESLFLGDSLQTAIDRLNYNRDAIASEFGVTDGLEHICYSYGSMGVPSDTQRATAGNVGSGTVAAGGSTDVTYSSTFPATSISVGMIARGDTIPDGEAVVVEVVSSTVVRLSKTLPAGKHAINYIGRIGSVPVTCDGSTTLIVTSTTRRSEIVVGMTVTGFGCPEGTTVTNADLSNGTVTVNQPVAATCKYASFELRDLDFYPTRVMDTLIANGYKTARRVHSVGGTCSLFKPSPLQTLRLPALSADTPNSATLIANIRELAYNYRDVVLYAHNPTSSTAWEPFLDELVAMREEGLIETPNLPTWWKNAQRRPDLI